MIKNFKHSNKLLGRYANLVCDTIVPYQEKAIMDKIDGLTPSYAILNFKNAAILKQTGIKPKNGNHKGCIFQDSDVAKWLEAAAYSLMLKPSKKLKKRVDEIVNIVIDAQNTDGYLNTFFSLECPENKFTDLAHGHEMYCSGHMIEAAVAIYEATGSKKLLDAMCKNADLLFKIFIKEKKEGYPGHPEIELALLKLWRVTNNNNYLTLAKHFIDVRGVDCNFFINEAKRRGITLTTDISSIYSPLYSQCHMPVREQTEAVGHAVRAMYLYTAMADLAKITNDSSLEKACFNLFENVISRRMYITGGIGSSYHNESFTVDYNLPNDTAYAETCASIGLIFFCMKLLKLQREGRISDVMERALYNTVLAGVQMDGKRFFYCNPLEILPGISGNIQTHIAAQPERSGWYNCACCPPNIARLLSSLANYAWDEEDGILYSNLFIPGKLFLPTISISVETNYPFDNTIKYKVMKGSGKLAIHIPNFTINEYKVSHSGELKNGYYYLNVKEGEEIYLKLNLTPKLNYSNINISSNSGRASITVGPVVYCAEGIDNNNDILALFLNKDSKLNLILKKPEEISGFTNSTHNISTVYIVSTIGYRLQQKDPNSLYFNENEYHLNEQEIKLIPYFMWGNRGKNQMRVWLPIK